MPDNQTEDLLAAHEHEVTVTVQDGRLTVTVPADFLASFEEAVTSCHTEEDLLAVWSGGLDSPTTEALQLVVLARKLRELL